MHTLPALHAMHLASAELHLIDELQHHPQISFIAGRSNMVGKIFFILSDATTSRSTL
jgi:hypothetical protein